MFQSQELVNEIDGLHKFALRLTNNSHEAEDLLQSTLLRALEKKYLFENGSNLFKWSSKIMFNIFASRYRRKARFESQLDPEPVIERQNSSANQYDRVQCLEIGEVMKKMSQEHRQVLLSICVKGLKYKTVANQLNVPVGTIRSRLARARKQLQQNLDY
ncbi:sigma-70 family RNA polymerase sigma factor [Methylomarinum sp. Ch1-1]|uniref:Sigma-70 family RNA polymerase sigma factor n=1 Tax=Methylomarinum roseum TaxID=3067653 RepID=A0AAU7NUS8_9GAMM|nr:sigma-70 family RNA polymerase sigma factor [Methylomarinum sp. Ch1-1]MDP4519165.1 sigma-70 family RNA polymerase sigma factor [Methylomarinum sp. Ch1-1]